MAIRKLSIGLGNVSSRTACPVLRGIGLIWNSCLAADMYLSFVHSHFPMDAFDRNFANMLNYKY